MGAVFNLSLPTSWASLSDKQLLMVYGLFARDLSASEVKTLCLMKWNKLTVLAQLRNHKYLVKRNRSEVAYWIFSIHFLLSQSAYHELAATMHCQRTSRVCHLRNSYTQTTYMLDFYIRSRKTSFCKWHKSSTIANI